MKKIPFVKYTLHGNKFVIVDETENPILTEEEKSHFAYQATNIYYGVGSDNFLVIQPCKPEVLKDINKNRKYWKKPPQPESDFIFRMFEPDGREAFSCGNGLLCVSNYLYTKYGITSAKIMTEIPTPSPRILDIGMDPNRKMSWSNMGTPRRISTEMVNPEIIRQHTDNIDIIKNIEIRLPERRFSDKDTSVTISGFLVFTGEPHLVIFTENGGISSKRLADYIFNSRQKLSPDIAVRSQQDMNCRLTYLIGMSLNKDYSDYFPHGLNINMVRILNKKGIIEYRCFERGINRETWACGTGAVAVAFISTYLKMVNRRNVLLFPYISHSYDPKAKLYVKNMNNDYFLYGIPLFLFEGTFIG